MKKLIFTSKGKIKDFDLMKDISKQFNRIFPKNTTLGEIAKVQETSSAENLMGSHVDQFLKERKGKS
tara:strand:- start:141 stop:341 length:201 start_codon:yes stop_codon:yes gene_type:complete